MVRNFKNLKIWLCGMEIARNCFRITSSFQKLQKFDLGTQINRSAVSIPSNIAEGVSRTSLKEFKRFIEIALGSSFELETQLLICRDIYAGNDELTLTTLNLINQEQKMLAGFLRSFQSLKSS